MPEMPVKVTPFEKEKGRIINFKRVLEIVGQVVEQHIAQPRPDHQAENNVGCHILDLVGGEFKTVLPFNPVQDQKKGDGKGNDIHQPVVLKPERTDTENDGIDRLR